MTKAHDDRYGNQQHYYQHIYQQVLGHDAQQLFKRLAQYPHRLMEKNFPSNDGLELLEIGVGAGEHIQFVVDDFKSYHAVDLSDRSFSRISELHPGIQLRIGDAQSLPYPEESFDRIIVTCLLSHLDDPEQALLSWYRIVRHEGFITLYLPAEPGLALRIFRWLLPKQKAKKLGFEGYDLFIAREHKSSLQRLMTLIHEHFERNSIRTIRRPFPFLGWYLNLFYIVHIKIDKKSGD